MFRPALGAPSKERSCACNSKADTSKQMEERRQKSIKAHVARRKVFQSPTVTAHEHTQTSRCLLCSKGLCVMEALGGGEWSFI